MSNNQVQKFETVFRGYNKEQVEEYFDNVIKEYEQLLERKKLVDQEVTELKSKLKHYEEVENTLNHAIMTAETAGDQIKSAARCEAESMVNEAKRNANRIINDALLKAEKAQDTANQLKRNVNVFKRRLKDIIENQMEVIDEIERIDFDEVGKRDW